MPVSRSYQRFCYIICVESRSFAWFVDGCIWLLSRWIGDRCAHVAEDARHFYDLFCLADRPEVLAMLQSSDEYEAIKADYDQGNRASRSRIDYCMMDRPGKPRGFGAE